jgi:hypothetical protein
MHIYTHIYIYIYSCAGMVGVTLPLKGIVGKVAATGVLMNIADPYRYVGVYKHLFVMQCSGVGCGVVQSDTRRVCIVLYAHNLMPPSLSHTHTHTQLPSVQPGGGQRHRLHYTQYGGRTRIQPDAQRRRAEGGGLWCVRVFIYVCVCST